MQAQLVHREDGRGRGPGEPFHDHRLCRFLGFGLAPQAEVHAELPQLRRQRRPGGAELLRQLFPDTWLPSGLLHVRCVHDGQSARDLQGDCRPRRFVFQV